MKSAARIDADRLAGSLWRRGYAELPALLTATECRRTARLYDEGALFRKRVDMAPLRFGEGEYQYFRYPLPPLVETLRQGFYPLLAPIANAWMEALGQERRYPATLAAFLDNCHRAGQERPTPLLLRYAAGGYNALHQDLYGAVAFPFQMAVFLSAPERDYTGGEFLLVEQRPRAQSVGHVIRPVQGDAVVFTTNLRPAKGARGFHRVRVRHGVGEVRSGSRVTLGIIFHDAR